MRYFNRPKEAKKPSKFVKFLGAKTGHTVCHRGSRSQNWSHCLPPRRQAFTYNEFLKSYSCFNYFLRLRIPDIKEWSGVKPEALWFFLTCLVVTLCPFILSVSTLVLLSVPRVCLLINIFLMFIFRMISLLSYLCTFF